MAKYEQETAQHSAVSEEHTKAVPVFLEKDASPTKLNASKISAFILVDKCNDHKRGTLVKKHRPRFKEVPKSKITQKALFSIFTVKP